MRRSRIGIAQRRHHIVSLVEQLKVPHTALVHFLHSVHMAFDELRPFYRLHNRRPAAAVRVLQIFQVQRAAHVSLFQLRVHCREPVEEVVSRIAGLVVGREIQYEAGTDGGKPGSLQLFRQRKVGCLRWLLFPLRLAALWMRLRASGIDMVVHVDADSSR